MNYQGDITLEDTLDVKFTTVAIDGVPEALIGGAVSAYIDNSVSQITAGITLTAGFDSVVGLNNVRVAVTAANGFATATNVNLVLTAGTVDGLSVAGYVVGSFSIGKRTTGGGGGGSGDASQATLLAVKAKTDALPTDPADASDITAQFAVTNGKVDAVAAKTNNLPADPADASDIAASFSTVNVKLDAIDDFVDTEVNAIKAKTDALPADPASASAIAASFTVTNGKIDVVDDYLDTEVAAIKAKTDQLVFTGGKVDANASLTLVAADLNNIADAILKRDWTSVSGEAAYSLLQAARMLRNVWSTTGGVLVVKKEDGTTNAWSRPLAVDPTAQPIVGAS